MKLYGHPISPRHRRIAIAAAELGLPLEVVELNIGKGENRTPEYLAKNPMGKIPTFEDDDGWTLWESFAVLVYLGEKHPERGLFPTQVRERADALRWMFWSASHLDPAIVGLVVQKVIAPMRGQRPDEAVIEASSRDLARFLPVLEAHLGGRTWMLGERFSMVDVALGASVDGLFLEAVGFDRGTCPNVAAWHRRLTERPAWLAATAR
jgi:glutathione S-transferase